jgi:hypothetical protein
MAEQSLDEMIRKEYQRVAGGHVAPQDTGVRLPGLVQKVVSAPVASKSAGRKLTAPVSNAGSTTIPAVPSGKASVLPPVTAPAAASLAKAVSAVTQNVSSSRQQVITNGAINKGYTEPVPLSQQPAQNVSSGGGSAAGSVAQTALKIFSSGLGLMPLISGLTGLFGGGGSTTPAPLVRYAMPRSIQIEAANSRSGGSFQAVDYGQNGAPRAYGEATGDVNAGAGLGATPAWPTQAGSGSGGAQIVVNVQAMDSRSFLDHSQDIATAVREAMLNMHPLNDVVSEL